MKSIPYIYIINILYRLRNPYRKNQISNCFRLYRITRIRAGMLLYGPMRNQTNKSRLFPAKTAYSPGLISKRHCMGCAYVREDNQRALASGLLPVQTQKHTINLLIASSSICTLYMPRYLIVNIGISL